MNNLTEEQWTKISNDLLVAAYQRYLRAENKDAFVIELLKLQIEIDTGAMAMFSVCDEDLIYIEVK